MFSYYLLDHIHLVFSADASPYRDSEFGPLHFIDGIIIKTSLLKELRAKPKKLWSDWKAVGDNCSKKQTQ